MPGMCLKLPNSAVFRTSFVEKWKSYPGFENSEDNIFIPVINMPIYKNPYLKLSYY